MESKITFYFKSLNLTNFSREERKLNIIVKEHVKSEKKVNVRSYYTPRRVSSYFSTRGHCSEDYKSYVVYQFNCKEVGCNSSYVGYTTNTLRTRIMQHRYKPSKICEHYKTDHKSPPTAEIANCFKILFQVGNFNYLPIAESLFLLKNLRQTSMRNLMI